MSIDEILQCSAAQLEAISDEELLKHFQKYLTTTRPEMAVKKSPPKPIQQEMIMTPEKYKKLELLREMGIDTSFVNRRKR